MSRLATIRQLKKELVILEGKKLEIDKQVEAVHATIQYLESSPEDPGAGASRHAEGIRDAIHEVLVAERPLHRKDIHDRLVAMGIHIGGNNPVNNVGAHLSLDPRFKNVGKGIWDLANDLNPVHNDNSQHSTDDRHWLDTVKEDGNSPSIASLDDEDDLPW